MKITVTQDHIDNGHPGNGKFRDVRTMRRYCYISGTAYKLPENASRFTRDFDYDRPVQPFTFEMELQS